MSDDALREFARQVFARGHEPAPEQDPAPATTSNVVPTEGNNPTPTRDHDLDELARALFGRNY